MKQNFYILLLLMSANAALGQVGGVVSKTDSTNSKKFAISTKNDETESGKYKHLTDLNIIYDKAHNTYSLAIATERNFDSYLEIKDQDDNVIYFKQIKLAAGNNIIALDTEDGDQTMFKLTFQDMKNDNPAVYVFREVKDVVLSNK